MLHIGPEFLKAIMKSVNLCNINSMNDRLPQLQPHMVHI